MTLLPGFRFETYPGFIDHGLIGEIGEYTEQPHWAHTERDGKKWVAKLGRDSAGRGIAAEAFSWLLGSEIGLRVPGAAIAVEGLKRAWLSERIEGARNWDPTDRDNIDNVDEVGAMLALDAVVANGDRHHQNVLVVHDPDALHLTVWAIDHGRADIVHLPRLILLGEGPPPVHDDRPDLTPARFRAGAMAAAEQMEALPEATIQAWLTEAFKCDGDALPVELPELVANRFKLATKIADRYLSALGVAR